MKGNLNAAEVSSKSLTQADLPVADFSINISSTRGSRRKGFLFLRIVKYGNHFFAASFNIHSLIISSFIFDNSSVTKIREEKISVTSSEIVELYLEISGSSILVAKIKLLCVPILYILSFKF